MTTIMIDAGHGGKDSGAIGNGIMEKNIVLILAKKIQALLEKNYLNVEVIQTRTEDVYLSLEERSKKANLSKADIFLSIHINASTNPSAKGFETHVYMTPNAKTQSFQNVMHSEIMRAISDTNGVQDRGKKRSNFHVIRETKQTALLSECMFISNSSDAALLKSSTFLNKLAEGHVNGLARFLGLSRKPVTISANPKQEDILYQVVVGTFRDKSNAEELQKDLKLDGYNAYIYEKE